MIIKKLYAIPTYKCNLSCRHCFIKNYKSEENFDLFLNTLKSINSEIRILFGGEPLLLSDDKFQKILNTATFQSISSNLLLLNENKINLLKKYKIDVATSWNTYRFQNIEQINLWFKNLNLCVQNKIYVTLLVTLTESLFQNLSEFNFILNKLDSEIGRNEYFQGIKFETYIPADEKLINKADNQLIEFYKNWKYKFINITAEQYKSGNINNCKNIVTVLPNGEIDYSCPERGNKYFLNKCLNCKYIIICKPCIKQKVCTFYKNFYNYLNKNHEYISKK